MYEPTEIDRLIDAEVGAIPDGEVLVTQYTELLSNFLALHLPQELDVNTAKSFALALAYVTAATLISATAHGNLPLEVAKLAAESIRDQVCNEVSRADLESALLEAAGSRPS